MIFLKHGNMKSRFNLQLVLLQIGNNSSEITTHVEQNDIFCYCKNTYDGKELTNEMKNNLLMNLIE